MTSVGEHSSLAPAGLELFSVLPRSLFLPDLCWPRTEDGYVILDRREDPKAWAEWAAADVAIVTQWDDGEHAGLAPGETPTSSASQPSIVADMLSDLDVQPGHRVLDVGAGTGWTTGLLATAAGAGNVTGIEVDPRVAEAAGMRLRAAGIDAAVIAGDGDEGWPAGAPFDRVQGTFAVRRVPLPWVEQTLPGGVIVVPWGTRFSNVNAIARLTVGGDRTASGPFTRPVEFMLDRGQRGTWPTHEEYLPGGVWPPDTRESKTSITLDDLSAAEWQVGVRARDLVHTVNVEANGIMAVFYGLTDRSWAVVFWCADACGKYDVFQGGERALWDEVESAYRWWVGEGRPGVERFGLTVSPAGQQVWLESPKNVLPPLA